MHIFKAIRFFNLLLIPFSVSMILICGFHHNVKLVDHQETDTLKQVSFEGGKDLISSKINFKFSLPYYLVPDNYLKDKTEVIHFTLPSILNYVSAYFKSCYYTFTNIHAP